MHRSGLAEGCCQELGPATFSAPADFFRQIEDVLRKRFGTEPNPLKTKPWDLNRNVKS